MDVYKYMYKVAPSTADKIIADADSSLPYGYVTDGMGNIYKIPTKGRTPLTYINNSKDYKFAYNWENATIEVYIRDLANEIDANNWEILGTYPVSRENFADGADYWFNVALDTLHEDIDSEVQNLQAAEAYEVFGEIIDDDKDNYKYEIKVDYEINDYPEDTYSNFMEFYNKVLNILSNYDITYDLYTQKIHVYAKKDESDTISIFVDYPMPLTKEELMDIWYNYEDHMHQMLLNNDITQIGDMVRFDIENIFEV